jgi:hypothetical protein
MRQGTKIISDFIFISSLNLKNYLKKNTIKKKKRKKEF